MKYTNNESDITNALIKLINLISLKDSYLKEHSERVAKYVLLIGEELKLDNKDLETIKIGAMIHDIGKVCIPDYLLLKDSTLSDKEFELIKRHVIIGEALLPADGYDELRKMIRNHHERLDGNGYPDGLKGTEIPYFARILSVADTFDAMTSQRSYNKIKTLDEALNELLKVSKKRINCGNEDVIQQLDPYIVNIFIKAIKNNKNLLEYFKKNDSDIISIRNKVKYKKW